jgi:NADPH-dependent 2,4-dienoyl-CoA reductase/sulfur reductase-like enzyme
MSEDQRIVVVGAGLAGMRAAERLRERGFAGEIVILGTETSMPYHRPALTKQFLTGALPAAELDIEPLEDLDAVWRLGTSVSRLDLRRRILHLPGTEELRYDGLVIATGMEARRVTGGQHGNPRIVVLRTIADARQLQRALAGNRDPVVVMGTGFIAGEVASSLRAMERDVTLVGRSAVLQKDVLGLELGSRLTQLHRERGVVLELGATIEEWAPGPRTVGLKLSNGKHIKAAAVVVALGTVPAVGWLRDSGVPVDNGVLCDETCHVTGLDDVVAAGDVARWPNQRFDEESRRVEHWTNAIEMGRAAAENLLAGRDAATPFTPIPRFWSEQHGLRIQAAGMPGLGKEQVALRPKSRGGQSVTGFLRDGRVMGVVGFNSSAAVHAYADELIQQRPPPSQGSPGRVSFLHAVGVGQPREAKQTGSGG